jgi:uncharacterized sulfatase
MSGAALAGGCAGPQTKRTAPPNVLFLAADDLNTRLGCYGHELVQSPHVDSLAATGVRFERAYCQFPLCGPTRASLLTGLRPDTTKVLDNGIDFRLNLPDAVTLPQCFRQNGYFTAREGKMFHMGVPGGVGTPKYQDPPSWDHSVSPAGTEEHTVGEGRNLTPTVHDGIAMHWISTGGPDGQADFAAAEHALTLLDEHGKEPFFLAVGFVRPHVPFVAPSRFFDFYPLQDIPLPDNPADDLDDIPEASKNVRPYLWHHMGMNEEAQREGLRGYYAATSFMDEQLGRVLGGLERMGLAENTIVVFWGDHGWNLGEHTRWQKMSLMEESTRVPLIVRAPGMAGNGRSCRGLVEFVDIYPTLTELCGLQPPDNLEGRSFAPLLRNPDGAGKKAAFTQLVYENRISGRTARTGDYRYIRWEGDGGGEELYDHRSDPGEFTNLALSEQHQPVLQQMREVLDAGWRAA